MAEDYARRMSRPDENAATVAGPPDELVISAGSSSSTGRIHTTEQELVVAPGTRIGMAVDPRRWCLGRRGADGVRIPCPTGSRIDGGRQCAACQQQDPWRWLHIVHRSPYGPDPALREHLMRPHWLYLATFAGGSVKVGTAVDERKRARLDEQGAVFAHWVGLAADGLEVRAWEDRVSREAGVGQVVRPAAKAAGLSGPVDVAQLRAQHERSLARVGELLADIPGATPLAEPWPNPRDITDLAGRTLRSYPGTLAEGEHGFTVQDCWGPIALVGLDGEQESSWAVDLSALTGHRVRWGEHATAVPTIQDSLF